MIPLNSHSVHRAFGTLKNEKEVSQFLDDMLTPKELDSLVERLRIFKMLSQGVPHRTISKTLSVSISKVTRGSHAYKKSRGSINQILARIS